MNRSNYPRRSGPLVPHNDVRFNVNINFTPNDWQVSPGESHSFLEDVRTAVLKYRTTSPTRFSVPIEVAQSQSQNLGRSDKFHGSFALWVGFYNFGSRPIFATCRFKSEKREGGRRLTDKVEVYGKRIGRYVPLEEFLEKMFPTFSEIPVGDDVMFQWWKSNGSAFNWPGLPTELKERIISFCMHRSQPRAPRRRPIKGAPEVTAQFGKWSALLGVSHQVRAISLRMCFVGSSDLLYDKGLCIDVKGHHAFKDCMRRLGKCFQMLEPGSLPSTDEMRRLADTYKTYPRIYPELSRYATFRHAIRKINFQLSFLDSMHFFKVTAGSFAQWFRNFKLDYGIFCQMPCLNEIRIQLPDARGSLSDGPCQWGPQLFYGEPFNCPRILHRLIYERVAEVLASYENVNMYGFMDEVEKESFYKLRSEERKKVRFTAEEIRELYRQDGGGVELEKSIIPGIQEDVVEESEGLVIQDAFWPPKCRCKVRCWKVLYPDTT
ncbi:hypothetical protein COCMIDRAFT_93661 [Bipolaris oryzae ATCC 44560]|uniref:Uncharacterized protein n=1 Tax=Bipolaris oryzae ATCC 44560 TaxID=930090 RepID=W6Z323_COCMI|nr:uncharacterized protein COCMIDRAFT_93661 [Bipolaris oryzae ATCC 44560]EUC46147.1 hypothetical protein COCMIDRAFT_93661 [Bipolaris oryzae ATCC 44560]